MSEAKISRRFFLFAAAGASGGFVIGPWFAPEFFDDRDSSSTQSKEFSLNAWLRISPDDVVTLISSQSEMGQGVMTTLPAILAEELGADWSRVKIEFSPVAPAYANPRINWQFPRDADYSRSESMGRQR
jgi:isoquinoline 1-oxidoreductase beta subunit